MYALTIECPEERAEILSAELWDAGARGIQEDTVPVARVSLKAFFEVLPDASAFAEYAPLIETVGETDWESEFRESWPALEVGKSFYLAAPWDQTLTPAGRIRLSIHPGMAFGTGWHQATQLALMALENHVRAGDGVADIGTGTGILLAAAHHLGAGRLTGCDLDVDSVFVARENLSADGVPASSFAGSTRALAPRCVDVLVANINPETHRSLRDEYARVARGVVILSGMAGPIDAAQFLPPGFRLTETLTLDEWTCLVLSRDVPS